MKSRVFTSLLFAWTLVSAAESTTIVAEPTTKIANLTVPDTPLVRAARDLAKMHLTEGTFNHVMRSWLFGVTLQQNNPAAFGTVDPETLAVAAILHDLGLDNSTFVSPDKRFEVDGAIAARNWVAQQQQAGLTSGWDENRLQVLWDAIALHAEPTFSQYKQPVVTLTSVGTACDFGGPNSDPTKTLTWDQYNAVVKEFPRLNLKDDIIKNVTWLCKSKPATTYGKSNRVNYPIQYRLIKNPDNWQMQYGLRFVPGFNTTGKLLIDAVLDGTLP